MRPLRIGLLLEGQKLQRWQAWCVEALLERGDITVELAICNRTPSPVPTGARKQLHRLRNLPSRLNEVPWIVLNRADQRFARRDRSGAGTIIEEMDLTSLSVEAPKLDVIPHASTSGLFHWFSDDDLATIEQYDLDILFRFGFAILRGPILNAARYGVWSFHHADNRVNRGGPPGFWEVARNEPVTGVILQRLSEQLDNGQVLARGWYSTNPMSWNRNFHRVLAQSRTLLTDAVSHLAHRGEVPQANTEPVNIYCHPLYREPDARAALSAATRCAARRLQGKFHNETTRRQWHLLWGKVSVNDLSVRRLNRLIPPPDRFWADPFPYTVNGQNWLFVEELFYATDRGRIVALQVEGNRVVRHVVVLDLPYHLSYPFLFEHDDVLYMIPESGTSGTINLWRCERFPDQWVLVHSMLADVRAVDSTLLAHDGRYYLFTNIARNAAADHNTELHVYVSDDPIDGGWRALPNNPVLVDSRCARMAGGFLHQPDGRIIRCAQFNGSSYGEAIALRSVDMVTPQHYAESGLGHLTPSWEPGLLGTHHLATSGSTVALDACRHIPRWSRRPRRHSLSDTVAGAVRASDEQVSAVPNERGVYDAAQSASDSRTAPR